MSISTEVAFFPKLCALTNWEEKQAYLAQLPAVRGFLEEHPLRHHLGDYCLQEQVAALQVIALGQGPIVFRMPEGKNSTVLLQRLLHQLVSIDRFYDSIGGIAGYHTTFMRLRGGEKGNDRITFSDPPTIDIRSYTPEVQELTRAGIDHLPQMAEIYPIGGAGDRLALTDEQTGEALPAALLSFQGRTLLEGLIRDLEAREALYQQIHGKRLVTPLVLMTSVEKNNADHIHCLLENRGWFGRPQESVLVITQLSVPVITEEGLWVMAAPLELRCKPGGHGALWKLMEDQGVFDWLAEKGRTKGLIRQINNPVAGVDYGLLAFAGAGIVQEKAFGFASCGREVGSAEGMDALFERTDDTGVHYGISNLEYTEFAKYGIEDQPKEPESRYSKFPSNTNLLFFDLETVRQLVRAHPLPGVVINLKHTYPYFDAEGKQKEAHAGRLETSVQNIADYCTVTVSTPAPNPADLSLPTYATYGRRQKTISVTKKQYTPGSSVQETPVGCYQDMMSNYRELLVDYCGIACPDADAFHCQIHPGLGPLYTRIAKKLRGGKIMPGSELQLDLAHVEIEGIDLDGSLKVSGDPTTRLELRRVRIENDGIDWSAPNRYWKEEITRLQCLEIVLETGAQFVAEDLVLTDSHRILVPAHTRLRATEKGLIEEPIKA